MIHRSLTTGVVALVVLCAGGVFAVGADAGGGVVGGVRDEERVQPVGAPAPAESPALPAPAELERLTRAFGGAKAVIRPSQDSQMGFSLPTRIMEVLVRNGDFVKKGQLLIRGDDAEDVANLESQRTRAASNATVERARAALDLAELEFQRTTEASQRGGATPQELDRARLTMAQQRAAWEAEKINQTLEELQVDRLASRVEKARVIAPYDGIIDNVAVDVGQVVRETDPVVRLVVVDPLWVDVPAPTEETVALGTKAGDKAWLLVTTGGRPRVVEGTVINVSPVADSASRTRRVRVELPNPAGAASLVAGEPVFARLRAPEPGWDAALTPAPGTAAPGTSGLRADAGGAGAGGGGGGGGGVGGGGTQR